MAMTPSCTFIVRGNIERYRRLIAEERDDKKRKTIVKLLAEAEGELQVLQDRQHAKGSDERGHPQANSSLDSDRR